MEASIIRLSLSIIFFLSLIYFLRFFKQLICCCVMLVAVAEVDIIRFVTMFGLWGKSHHQENDPSEPEVKVINH